MPGTFQVSVLEFKGIPSSSPPSSVFIKVSLGKTEYQTFEKGDFSFPLTTLRDSLIVTIQEAEGNEISKIVVHSMAIVEKGIWDDLFPLEGGGHVHMKLQFSLSEEERNRIRGMRELALKKKQREELSKNIRYSRVASDAGDSVASSSPINHEVSGGGACKEDGPLQSNSGKEEATLQMHVAPNATEYGEESSSAKMSPRTEVHHMPLRKNDTELPHSVVSEAPNTLQSNSFMSRGTEPVVTKIKPVLLKLEDKQVPLRKPASSIMKMISAFETTPMQEKKPPIIQVVAKSQSNRARKDGPLKDQVLAHVTKAPDLNPGRPEFLTDLSSARLGNEEVSTLGRLLSPAQISPERLGNPTISGNLQQLPPDSMNKGKHIGFLNDIGKIVSSSAATRQLLIPNTSIVQQTKAHETVESELLSDNKEKERGRDKSPEVLMEESLEPRNDKFLPKIKNTGEHVDIFKSFDDNKPSQDAGQVMKSSAINVESAEGNASIKSKTRSDLMNTVVSHEDVQHQHETSRAWIFPNDTRRMCVTTGVTEVIDLYDCCHAEAKAHNIMEKENLDKHTVGSEEIKESGSDKLDLRITKSESCADNAFTGPVKQAIKIAIVVGFGALVLFTRQREPRKSSRKANDPFFSTLPFTDLQSMEK